MSQSDDTTTKRSKAEERVLSQLEKIQKANKLKNFDETYDHIINNWYMFDAHWLAFVGHMKDTGRLNGQAR